MLALPSQIAVGKEIITTWMLANMASWNYPTVFKLNDKIYKCINDLNLHNNWIFEMKMSLWVGYGDDLWFIWRCYRVLMIWPAVTFNNKKKKQSTNWNCNHIIYFQVHYHINWFIWRCYRVLMIWPAVTFNNKKKETIDKLKLQSYNLFSSSLSYKSCNRIIFKFTYTT